MSSKPLRWDLPALFVALCSVMLTYRLHASAPDVMVTGDSYNEWHTGVTLITSDVSTRQTCQQPCRASGSMSKLTGTSRCYPDEKFIMGFLRT